MDDGLSQELVPEVIGKVAVIATVYVLFQFGRGFVDQLCGHAERIDAQLFRSFLRYRPVEFGLARCYEINGAHELRNFELFFAELNHAAFSM